MDFRHSERTLEWAKRARRFADEVVRPRAAELDACPDPVDCWSWEIVEEADAAGIRQAPLPAVYGGSDTDHLTNVAILEEIAAADLGAGVIFANHWKFLQAVHVAAADELRARLLGRLAGNSRGLLAFGLTEPGAGSDNLLPYNEPGVALQTAAVKVPGGYRISGTKCYISNANRADILLCAARTDPDGPLLTSATCFAVPVETEGVSFGVIHDKAGERLENNAEIHFDGAFVPEENIIGGVGGLFRSLGGLLQVSNTYAAACALGVLRECYDRSLARSRQRVQGGRPIIDHQAIGHRLAEMYMTIDVTRTYLWRAAWNAMSDQPAEPQFTLLPKLFASERLLEGARTAMEVWAGAGFMRGNGIEKLWRDASVWLHSDGTNIVLRERMANQIRGAHAF